MDEIKERKQATYTKYTGLKINSIKWRPTSQEDGAHFITGSWDNEANNITLWQMNSNEDDPFLVQEIPFTHDINDIQYVNQSSFVTGTGDGSIYFYHHDQIGIMSCRRKWSKCHRLASGSVACTALATIDNQVASVGEDGKIFLLDVNEDKPLKILGKDNDSSHYAVMFTTNSQILTGNMQGHMKLWDLRDPSNDHLKSTLLSPDQVSVKCLTGHPTQQHLVVAGLEDGSFALWDMRAPTHPFVLIAGHSGAISDMAFHPFECNNLFTCGYDGKLLLWNVSSSSPQNQLLNPSSKPKKDLRGDAFKSISNPWFSEEVKNGFVDGNSLLPDSNFPVNCLSVISETLIAGSDNECICIVKNVLYE